ncbi:MAG: polysaccharide deacetylase family protein [Bacteroidota bacterium]
MLTNLDNFWLLVLKVLTNFLHLCPYVFLFLNNVASILMRPSCLLLLSIIYLSFSACGPNQPISTAKSNIPFKVEPTPTIAVTIDDLPGISLDDFADVTDKLLTTLRKYEVPAIGFVNEGKLYHKRKLEETKLALLEDWLEAGMELGNHTYSHPDYNKLTFEEFSANLLKGEKHTKALQAKYGQKMAYFRHPFLHKGNTAEKKAQLEQFLIEQDYIEAPVTIDNAEWVFAKAYHVSLRAKDSLQMKKIGASYVEYMEAMTAFYESNAQTLFGRPIAHTLLIHANALNGDYLDELLAMYQQRGYQFVSLKTALEDEAYLSKDEFVGRGGITWLHRWAITQKVDKSFFAGEPACPAFIQEIAGIRE